MNVSLDEVTCDNETRGLNCLKIQAFSQWNDGTIDDGPVKNSRKVALHQVAFENEARGLKILKVLVFSRCNEGTIGDGAVNNPLPTDCNVIETISVLKFPQVHGSLYHARRLH